jgi:hypothetical protein
MKKLIWCALVVFSLTDVCSADGVDFLKKMNEDYDPTISISEPQIDSHRSTSQCEVSTFTLMGTDPVNLKQRPVKIDLYHPLNPVKQSQDELQNLGTVVLLPPIVGVSILDRWSVKDFCNAGLETVVVCSWGFYTEAGLNWDIHDKDSLRALTAARHAIEFAVKNKPGPIGIIGTSQGSLTASIVLSVDPRASTGVLIVAGGPLSKIAATSTNKLVRKVKKERFKKFNIKDEYQYEDILAQNIQIDTLELAEKSTPKKIWMFIASKDKVVAAETQWKLWKAWKEPAYHIVKLDHVWTVLNTFFFHHKKITQFFVENLKY